MANDAQTTLVNFAIAFEQILGTEKTKVLIESLTEFANNCPETVQELDELVMENPQMFSGLLTPKGVKEIKEYIEMAQNFIPSMGMFGK